MRALALPSGLFRIYVIFAVITYSFGCYFYWGSWEVEENNLFKASYGVTILANNPSKGDKFEYLASGNAAMTCFMGYEGYSRAPYVNANRELRLQFPLQEAREYMWGEDFKMCVKSYLKGKRKKILYAKIGAFVKPFLGLIGMYAGFYLLISLVGWVLNGFRNNEPRN